MQYSFLVVGEIAHWVVGCLVLEHDMLQAGDLPKVLDLL